MTSGGFILQCRELKDLSSQGQAGLDLDVYDLVTDSVRDVKLCQAENHLWRRCQWR